MSEKQILLGRPKRLGIMEGCATGSSGRPWRGRLGDRSCRSQGRNRATVTDKTESDYHFRVGIRLLANGELSEAREAFTTSLTLGMQPKALCYRGLAYFMGKEYGKALADYTSAIELDDPSIPEVYYFRGTLHSLLRNNGEAIQDLTKAIELQDEGWLADAYYYRGANFGAIGEYDMAIDDMRMAAGAGHGPAREFLKLRGLGW
jgi:tetratricopeptide (TPR) repeat protein